MQTTNASQAEFRAAREPTGPEPVSLWRVLRGHRADPLVRWTDIREAHGDVAHYRFATRDTYFISSADGVRRVLQDNAANYTKQHPSYRMLRRLLGNGLLTSEGSFWLRQRRLAQPAFHKGRLGAMASAMTAAALELSDSWERAAGEPLPMAREMSKLTLQVVGDALFGAELADKAAPVARAWEVLGAQLAERFAKMRLLPPILPTAYDRAFREARRTLFRVVDEIIASKRARVGRSDDLLSMFMEARDEDTGERMSDEQLRDEVVTMLLAGHETTAVGLTWAWARLDAHPDAARELHAEVDRVLGGRPPSVADLAELTYTRAVISETLRLHPPAYIINRHVLEDDVICGHRVGAGGSIVISPLVMHRHPAYWERPAAFDPRRWLDAEAEKRRPRFAYIPFSAGPRQCIGNHFSMMEATLVLASLAQRFSPELVVPSLPATEYAVLARPAGEVRMRIRRRSPARAGATARESAEAPA
ncbi:MAG: cytochrome P450 [Polyangiaceae bacterium]|nr:cytochrome P450 [Polyangiaceae bacterium]